MAKFGIGQPVRRVEDPRLVTGAGRYSDDINLPNQVHGFVLRSPHAHARIRGIDTSAAKAAPGVLAILTGAELGSAGDPVHRSRSRTATARAGPTRCTRSCARTRSDYVGDNVAFVVAETPGPGAGRGRADRGRLRRPAGRRRHREGDGRRRSRRSTPRRPATSPSTGTTATPRRPTPPSPSAAHVTKLELVNNQRRLQRDGAARLRGRVRRAPTSSRSRPAPRAAGASATPSPTISACRRTRCG